MCKYGGGSEDSQSEGLLCGTIESGLGQPGQETLMQQLETWKEAVHLALHKNGSGTELWSRNKQSHTHTHTVPYNFPDKLNLLQEKEVGWWAHSADN